MEGDRHGLSYGACRRELRLREQGWHELRWRKKIDLKLPRFASRDSYFEMVQGVLYVFERNEFHELTRRAARVALPTLKDEEQPPWQPIWEELDLGCVAIRFFLDPTQDLLVIVENNTSQSVTYNVPSFVGDSAILCADVFTTQDISYNLHLRTLSTNCSHPKAYRPILRSPHASFFVRSVQVDGSLIGVLSYQASISWLRGTSSFDLWNWRTGVHQHVSCFIDTNGDEK